MDITTPIFWNMEHYTKIPFRYSAYIALSWSFGWVQQYALSIYSAWTTYLCFTEKNYRDPDNWVLLDHSISPISNILSHMEA